MKKAYYISLLMISLFSSIVKADTWRVLFYMDASDSLSYMAFKSITEMMQAQIDDTVECYIQLHAYQDVGLRYRLAQMQFNFQKKSI